MPALIPDNQLRVIFYNHFIPAIALAGSIFKRFIMKSQINEFSSNLDAHQVYTILKEGNKRFAKNTGNGGKARMQNREEPAIVILSCIDCPDSPETIFDIEQGKILNICIAGNVVNDEILGSIEYACKTAGAKLIVVLGHTKCGVVKEACEGNKEGQFSQLHKRIQPAVESSKAYGLGENNYLYLEKVSYTNVINSMAEIMQRSPVLNEWCRQGKAGIVAGMYNLESRRVHFVREVLPEQIKEFPPAEKTG